ncbi:MAG: 50S ribosomal protein L19 [Planctomycetota bacterium]|nr:50S ribosomal protein L19 [Planctomycetota bacterium]MEC8559567.1 50S ribosomal protein L19 [Planctomycetota bacterium]MEC9157783.1 50S ribosomal protein L19 [Planctomycetota bacterium]MEC9234243.1 50S ribosomal protein L19 [Planctomycetota bacterium]
MSQLKDRQAILNSVVADQLKKDHELPMMSVGDTIDVHYRIIEGTKERIQVFQGVYIARNHSGINETITVRRIVANEGVERIFPLHSPRLAKIEVVRRGDARRAKLYYLRDRIGKSRRLRDQRRGLQHVEAWEAGHADRVAASKAGQDSAEAAPPTGDE